MFHCYIWLPRGYPPLGLLSHSTCIFEGLLFQFFVVKPVEFESVEPSGPNLQATKGINNKLLMMRATTVTFSFFNLEDERIPCRKGHPTAKPPQTQLPIL